MSDSPETLGERLQAARGLKGLTAQKAADALHLDGWVIEGLESGNYERIGPSVYAKGHLRRYAELLGLPVAEVLQGFDGPPPEVATQAPSPALRMRAADSSPVRRVPWRFVAVAVVIALVAAVLIWVRPWHPRATVTATSAPAGGAAVPAESHANVGSGTELHASGTAAPTSIVTPTPTPTPGAGAADSKVAAGRARLRLTFLGDSWVDVHDAMGRRLFAGLGHVNNIRTLSGEAPFRVYFKSASSLRLEINNRAVTVGPPYVMANVAHFEVGADGALRRDPHFAAPN